MVFIHYMYFVYFIPIGDLVNMGSLLRLVLLKSVFVTVFASINNVSTECSKFDFEEKILEKLIKLEYKMQTHEELINKWKIDLQTGLKNIEEVKQDVQNLTTNNQIVFSASMAASQDISNGVIVRFDHAIINQGNGYDPNIGIFTAPRPGLYYFSVVLMSSYSKELFLHLKRNGDFISGSSSAGHTGYSTNPITTAIQLERGDKVYVKCADGRSQTIYSDANRYGSFTGFLLE